MAKESSTKSQMFLMTLKMYHHRSHLHILNTKHFAPFFSLLLIHFYHSECKRVGVTSAHTAFSNNHGYRIYIGISQISFLYLFYHIFFPHIIQPRKKVNEKKTFQGKQKKLKSRQKKRYSCAHFVYSLAFWDLSFQLSFCSAFWICQSFC